MPGPRPTSGAGRAGAVCRRGWLVVRPGCTLSLCQSCCLSPPRTQASSPPCLLGPAHSRPSSGHSHSGLAAPLCSRLSECTPDTDHVGEEHVFSSRGGVLTGENHPGHGGAVSVEYRPEGCVGSGEQGWPPVRGVGRGCVCRAGWEAEDAEGGVGGVRGGRGHADSRRGALRVNMREARGGTPQTCAL